MPAGTLAAPWPTCSIRLADVDDAEAIRTIYNLEVTTATSTFDLVPRSLADQQAWLAARSGAFAAIVAVDGDRRRGRVRLAVAVQGPGRLPHDRRGLGLRRPRAAAARASARPLLTRLLDVARASGFHAVIARIEASGAASLALHARCGFELVGIEREVGRKFNRWLDVAVMQRLL